MADGQLTHVSDMFTDRERAASPTYNEYLVPTGAGNCRTRHRLRCHRLRRHGVPPVRGRGSLAPQANDSPTWGIWSDGSGPAGAHHAWRLRQLMRPSARRTVTRIMDNTVQKGSCSDPIRSTPHFARSGSPSRDGRRCHARATRLAVLGSRLIVAGTRMQIPRAHPPFAVIRRHSSTTHSASTRSKSPSML